MYYHGVGSSADPDFFLRLHAPCDEAPYWQSFGWNHVREAEDRNAIATNRLWISLRLVVCRLVRAVSLSPAIAPDQGAVDISICDHRVDPSRMQTLMHVIYAYPHGIHT